MGLGETALILLGVGIVSQRFGAGLGLEQLGVGISTLTAAPLTGTGLGLSTFSGGLRDLAESLGDIGRGFGTLFENIPRLPPGTPGDDDGQQLESVPLAPRLPVFPLVVKAGGGSSELLPGGGGSTPLPSPPPLRRPSTSPQYLTISTSMNDERARAVMM